MRNRNYIAVYFDDEIPLLKAVKKLRSDNEVILDVLSPFPVHGLDAALDMKRTKIPIGGFIIGALGTLFSFGFQAWVFTISYPLIIGGKPLLSAPAFIPITFEVTVLFGGVAMGVAFLIRSKLNPDIRFTPLDPNITDDMFVVLVEATEQADTEKIRTLLYDTNPREIRYSEQTKQQN